MSAHERIWTFYLATVLAVVAAFGGTAPDPAPVVWYAVVHAALLGVVRLLPRLARTPYRLAVARGAYSTIALPIVFSTLALVLPALHPEPYEFTWIAADRALCGCDPTVALQAILWPPFVEVLQLCYASFYLIPIVAVLAGARRGGLAVFERGIDLIVLGFALSYVGYLLWPSLPPYRFLEHVVPIRGLWFAESIHAALDAAELHKWNCFPSGHTMMAVLSLVYAWREARAAFWALLPVVALLVLSTVALRYHYVVDVLAGLAAVPPTLWLAGQIRGELTPRPALPPRAAPARGTSRAARTTP